MYPESKLNSDNNLNFQSDSPADLIYFENKIPPR